MAFNEEARFVEKQRFFAGTAKIHLTHLNFDSHIPQPAISYLDAKNIERLVQIFKLEGCLRLDLAHHVPAVISDQVLKDSLSRSHVEHGALFQRHDPPMLGFPEGTSLLCLHGKHRIAAAKQTLLPGSRWWTVDLYFDGLSDPVRGDIQEEYANSRNFCDGDIFRQIRYCQQNADVHGEGRWLARLSDAKRKDLKQLQRRTELKPVAEALDNLLSFTGFWPSLQIGTFHRLLNMKCPEELSNYLRHIVSCWDYILDGNAYLRSRIDFGTVQLLQTLCPWASQSDLYSVEMWMGQGRLFPMVLDPMMRASILDRLRTLDVIIPSLHTFLEDTKWLEPCAQILRGLLPPGCRETTRDAVFKMYTGLHIVRVQENSTKIVEHRGTEDIGVECGYRQLWLFAWRYFPELSGIMPRKDKGEAKPRAMTPSELYENQFFQLADRLGFRSYTISTHLQRQPDFTMASRFLRETRPEDIFRLPETVRSEAASQICDILQRLTDASEVPERSNTSREVSISIEHRCGRPYQQSLIESKVHFFFPKIYASKPKGISHYTVNRDIFWAFFGPFSRWNGDLFASDRDNSGQVDTQMEEVADVASQPGSSNLSGSNVAANHDQTDDGMAIDSFSSLPGNPSVAGNINPPANEMETENTNPQYSNVLVTREGTILSPLHVSTPVTNHLVVTQITAAPVSLQTQIIHQPPVLNDRSTFQTQGIVQANSQLRLTGSSELTLFEEYSRSCHDGDLFLVAKEDPKSCIVRSNRLMPIVWRERINSHICFVFDSSKGGIKCVIPSQLRPFQRTPRGYDGVVFFFPKKWSGEEWKKVKGESTEDRLLKYEEVEEEL